jgi:hypothetical protein
MSVDERFTSDGWASTKCSQFARKERSARSARTVGHRELLLSPQPEHHLAHAISSVTLLSSPGPSMFCSVLSSAL